MPSGLTRILVMLTGVVLIVLMAVLYLRSRQGDQRVIRLTNQTLLPVLSILVIMLNFIFANRQRLCTGWLSILPYAGLVVAVLLIVAGCVRYFVSQSRDRRHITHPILWSVILITLVFLIESANGCL